MKLHNKIKLCILIGILLFANGCNNEPIPSDKTETTKTGQTTDAEQPKMENATTTFENKEDQTDKISSETTAPYQYFNEAGTCLKERILTPEGFTRISYKKNSFGAFLEKYPLCESGQPVLLYDGREKGNQNAHVAVFDMKVTEGDLQQCADSVIRMYAEYFYSQKKYDKMKFHFVNGFSCDFDKWSQGMRVSVSGNDTSWYQKGGTDDSEEADNSLR